MTNNSQIRITFKNLDHSDTMEERARKKLDRLDKFLINESTPIHIDLVFEGQRTHHHHSIELRVNSPHYHLIASDEGPEMYTLLDRVIDKMITELRKAKDKNNNHIHKDGPHRPG